MSRYELSLCDADYTIYKLPRSYSPGELSDPASTYFMALMYAQGEATIIAADECRIDGEVKEAGWRRLTIDGTLPFDIHGALVQVLSPLAEAEVSVLVCSAFSTDHIFVKGERLDVALDALRRAHIGVKENAA
ncbi:ACT domain-containing protein [Phytohalomonas tamaricis]|uniref:ACT domain-containing protein n=1 Tax=Phytohalomonas tamaricis TaxID=2081032 RepID=UPI0021D3F98F|nr:ACT domain-containing protein [Phytohalomonas tamaricis]